MTSDFPEVSGELDAAYLDAALRRAGRGGVSGTLTTEALLEGRTGATVQRLRAGDRSYVLKFVHDDSWRVVGAGLSEGGEHRLWAHGLTRDVPGSIRCPVVDVGHEPDTGRYWMLMDDVSDGIRGRGKFSRDDTRTLFDGLAAMQAPLAGSATLDDAPLPSVAGTTDVLRLGMLHIAGKRTSDAEWIQQLVTDFQVVSAFLPVFLDVLGSGRADDYLALCADDSWVRTLGAEPQTLLHGDLRRANMSLNDAGIDLFDWEFAARGPAGCDLQWHCLLHYWGYPPDGVEAGDDCDDLADHYVQRLGEHLDGPVDRDAFDRGWKLGWIKVMAQLGYVLIDPLYPDGGDDDARRRIGALCHRAVERALDFRAQLG